MSSSYNRIHRSVFRLLVYALWADTDGGGGGESIKAARRAHGNLIMTIINNKSASNFVCGAL